MRTRMRGLHYLAVLFAASTYVLSLSCASTHFEASLERFSAFYVLSCWVATAVQPDTTILSSQHSAVEFTFYADQDTK